MALFDVLSTGSSAGQRFTLTAARVVIGRHPGCGLVLDASAVSRQHAVVTAEADGHAIEDLGSRNGTFVNGERLESRRRLADGDTVTICEVRLIYHAGSGRLADGFVDGMGTSEEIIDEAADQSVIMSQVDLRQRIDEAQAAVNAEAKLKAVLGISRAIAGSLSINDVLPRLLEGIFTVFPKADRGFVLLIDPGSRRFVLRAKKIRGEDPKGAVRLSTSLIRRVAESGTAMLSADIASDSRFKSSDSLAACRVRSMMCVPFLDSAGEVIGILQVDSHDVRDGFQPVDLELLVGVAGQAAQAVEHSLAHEARIQQEHLKRDLELAHRVQQGLLPSRPVEIPGYSVFDFYEPAKEIGGDFFGYVPLAEGRVAIVLADVCGKGVSAALVMAALSADVRYCLASERDVAQAVGRINESFCRSGWDDRFATLIVAVLDPASHRLTVVNAGHLPALLRRPDGTVVEVGTESGGLPLGVDPQFVYDSTEAGIDEGSALVMFTDGISEAMDQDGGLYGLARVGEVVGSPGLPAEVGRRVLADVERHAAGQVRSDDMCLVCLTRLNRPAHQAELPQSADAARGAPLMQSVPSGGR